MGGRLDRSSLLDACDSRTHRAGPWTSRIDAGSPGALRTSMDNTYRLRSGVDGLERELFGDKVFLSSVVERLTQHRCIR